MNYATEIMKFFSVKGGVTINAQIKTRGNLLDNVKSNKDVKNIIFPIKTKVFKHPLNSTKKFKQFNFKLNIF